MIPPQTQRPIARCALIVAHGAPADPNPQELVLRGLAADVARLMPGWRIAGTTLAADGALEAALTGLTAPLIYPFFMATGWFTGTALPRRLNAAGITDARQLAPLGADPALPDLMQAAALAGLGARQAQDTTLLIAAHGSKVSRTSADTTQHMVAALAARGRFARVTSGFVEEAPFLAQAARDLGPAVCLPFFAISAGHVTGDLPQALQQAGFDGPLLAPIGEHQGIPALIAGALHDAAQAAAT